MPGPLADEKLPLKCYADYRKVGERDIEYPFGETHPILKVITSAQNQRRLKAALPAFTHDDELGKSFKVLVILIQDKNFFRLITNKIKQFLN